MDVPSCVLAVSIHKIQSLKPKLHYAKFYRLLPMPEYPLVWSFKIHGVNTRSSKLKHLSLPLSHSQGHWNLTATILPQSVNLGIHCIPPRLDSTAILGHRVRYMRIRACGGLRMKDMSFSTRVKNHRAHLLLQQTSGSR